ncbi:MAG: hypothetical protein JSR85_04195 [Proteobacteria bacterium]|nr:hypothetical protein [Pseudomonadota bacterium]
MRRRASLFLFILLMCFVTQTFSAECTTPAETEDSSTINATTDQSLSDLPDLSNLPSLKNLSPSKTEGLCYDCKNYCYACQYCTPTGACNTTCQQPNPPKECSHCFNCSECGNCNTTGLCGEHCGDNPPYCPPPGKPTTTCYTPDWN